MNHPIILYDGVCHLCNGVINYILPRDKKRYFRFSPLQSETGQALLQKFNLPTDDYDSFVLVEGDKHYVRSGAAIKVMQGMGFPYSLGATLWILPRPLRDALYNWVAKNRYKWFGQYDTCLMPTPDIKERFLL
jgi:predicted DCC family thiol-disulfide oxidoreductase YuxK